MVNLGNSARDCHTRTDAHCLRLVQIMGTQQGRHGSRLMPGPLGGIIVVGSIFVASCGGGGGDTNSPPGTLDDSGHSSSGNAAGTNTENNDDGGSAPAEDTTKGGDAGGSTGNPGIEVIGGSNTTGGKASSGGGGNNAGANNIGGTTNTTPDPNSSPELAGDMENNLSKMCGKYDAVTDATVVEACTGYVQVGTACLFAEVVPPNPVIPMTSTDTRATWYLKFYDAIMAVKKLMPCKELKLGNADQPGQKEENEAYCSSCFNSAVNSANASMSM